MVTSPVDTFIFAPLAPLLGVLLFWFIQLLFIDSFKYFLSKIWQTHESFCLFTNFIGILFQTICHALGYTITKSGIQQFQVTIHYGKVKPKKEKTGIFQWISNAFLFIGPFFIPPIILLLPLIIILPDAFTLQPSAYTTFAQGLIHFGQNLYNFAEQFIVFIFTIDLLHPVELGFFLLLLFFGMGIRPSYIAEQKKEKISMIYDLANIKNGILHRPLYLLLLFLLSYCIYYISLGFDQNWYSFIFAFFGWLSIIAIISLLIAHLFIIFIHITDEIPRPWRMLPYITLPSSYILIRTVFYFYPTELSNTLALITMLAVTILVIYLLLKYKTNKFKTTPPIKPSKKIIRDDSDEPRRLIK